MRRKISIVRALHRSIFGRNSGAGSFSTSVHATPRRPRSMASVSPTGPAPTTTTSVDGSRTSERSLHRFRLVGTAGAAAPEFPRALEGERSARTKDGGDLAVAQKRHVAERLRLHLQLGVELKVN